MQAIARQVTDCSLRGKLKFVVVDPVMHGGAISPIGEQAKWVPIKPATDGAFAMALIRWIIENNKFNAKFLSSPSLQAARKNGFNSWTNAAHLVIVDDAHPNNRRVLRAEDIGLPLPPLPAPDPNTPPGTPAKKPDYFVVMDKATGKPVIYTDTLEGDILFNGEVTGQDGKVIKVKTAFNILKESAFSEEMAAYAKACGIPTETIIEIGQEFTAHGTKVGIDGLGNTAASNGMDGALAHYVLGALVGSYYKKGGIISAGPSYKSFAPGPRYDLAAFPGAPKPQGVAISRTGFPYEKTTEFKNKVAQGEKPYPPKLPWYTFGTNADNQAIFSMVNGYPYQAKILMVWMANPLFSTPAAAHKDVVTELKNPERIPLFIAMDAFMGETSALADFIIPDTTQFESWGLPAIWGNFAGKGTSVRWPVVQPLTAKIADGRFAGFENYLIDVAKKIGLPGFGDKAIPGPDNKMYPLNKPEEYFLRAVANVAFDGAPVPALSAGEAGIQDLDTATAAWKDCLTPDEWPQAKYVLARGGRFEAYGEGFAGDNYKYGAMGCFNIYMEALATAKNSFDGKPFYGVIGWHPEAFADGTLLSKAYPEDEWPFKGASYKAKFRSATMLVNSILRDLNPSNHIEINTEDAKRLGFKDGEKVKLISATGGEATGILKVRPGVALGTVAVAFGYGHWEYGSRAYQVGDKQLGGDSTRGTGVLLSGIGLLDPTVKGVIGFSEMSTGGPGRNGGAYRIEKA